MEDDKFIWQGDCDITAEEAINGFSKLSKAKKWLRQLAQNTKEISSKEIFELADMEDISKRTLNSAKRVLGINAKKIKGNWYWDLSEIKQ